MSDSLDDRIARWHLLEPGQPGYDQELHEYLGYSWNTYRRIVRGRGILRQAYYNGSVV